ncbi:hypothetical protein RJT34_32622 [Clitoria ternatea]|uniref:Uncharacterized protein n=1 Tax=Clitoria ternatea TaxID=43366 RepID=A0AAN9EYN1_CLITE
MLWFLCVSVGYSCVQLFAVSEAVTLTVCISFVTWWPHISPLHCNLNLNAHSFSFSVFTYSCDVLLISVSNFNGFSAC